jgi:hypothetical protein
MADTNIYVQSGDGRLVPVDTRNAPNGDQRQVFLLGDGENEGLLSPATEETLAALVAAVGTRLAAGDAVELGPAALAALETITAAVSGTVELGATSLAALENITATISGPITVAGGTYGYAAGTAAGTVDVPTGARVKRVSVIAGASAATVAIAGGATITIPAGGSFDEQVPGDTTAGADVVIGGTVSSFYVGWVA